MLSSAEQLTASKTLSRRLVDAFEVWNRKLHFYIGLYLLFFLWLFSFTGMLLNHSGWKFAEFWENRHQTQMEREIVPPPPGADLVQAKEKEDQGVADARQRQPAVRGGEEDDEARLLRFDHVLRPLDAHRLLQGFDNSRKAVYGYDQRLEVFCSNGTAMADNEAEDTVARGDPDGFHSARPPFFFMQRYAPCYVDDDTLLSSVWRTVTGPAITAVVRFGEPQQSQGRGRREWAMELRSAVEALRQTA